MSYFLQETLIIKEPKKRTIKYIRQYIFDSWCFSFHIFLSFTFVRLYNFTPLFIGIRVAQSFVFSAMFCKSLFFYLSVILRFMASNYPYGIFKLFSHRPGDKSWMRKWPDCYYDKRNVSVVSCDTDIQIELLHLPHHDGIIISFILILG
jgi:hypothetical protein